MAKKKQHKDKVATKVEEVLSEYTNAHSKAKLDVQRQNSVSIRIRIIDPDFSDMNRVERDDLIWEYLKKLPEEVQSEITMVLLLTPKETRNSFANMDFEDPIPSRL